MKEQSSPKKPTPKAKEAEGERGGIDRGMKFITLLGVFIFLDMGQGALALIDGGVFTSYFFTFFAAPLAGCWILALGALSGTPILTPPKIIGVLTGTFIESVPLLNILPSWTAVAYYLMKDE